MKPRLRKTLIGLSAALTVLLMVAGGYTWYLYHSVKVTASKIYEPLPSPLDYISKDPLVTQKVAAADQKGQTGKGGANKVPTDERHPFTVLVLGVDQREHDRGRSDSIIVLSVNPMKQSMLMFNIPRDTRTEIVGRGTIDKINHAYAFGDVEMSLKTVENFLDYPIDYYIKMNMEGFENIVDLFGGVTVNNSMAFQYEGVDFGKGELFLNGSDALLYSRMRYEDPRGDFGRNTRQRQILTQVIDKAMSISSASRIFKILHEIGDHVKTNITYDEMRTFISKYRSDLKGTRSIEIHGTGQTINKIWYYVVTDAERLRIHNVLLDHQKSK